MGFSETVPVLRLKQVRLARPEQVDRNAEIMQDHCKTSREAHNGGNYLIEIQGLVRLASLEFRMMEKRADRAGGQFAMCVF